MDTHMPTYVRIKGSGTSLFKDTPYVDGTFLILLLGETSPVSCIPKSTYYKALFISLIKKASFFCVVVTLNLYVQSKSGFNSE